MDGQETQEVANTPESPGLLKSQIEPVFDIAKEYIPSMKNYGEIDTIQANVISNLSNIDTFLDKMTKPGETYGLEYDFPTNKEPLTEAQKKIIVRHLIFADLIRQVILQQNQINSPSLELPIDLSRKINEANLVLSQAEIPQDDQIDPARLTRAAVALLVFNNTELNQLSEEEKPNQSIHNAQEVEAERQKIKNQDLLQKAGFPVIMHKAIIDVYNSLKPQDKTPDSNIPDEIFKKTALTNIYRTTSYFAPQTSQPKAA